jgi:hypothetical protein
MRDRLAVLQSEALQIDVELVLAEDPHEVVVEAQVELRMTRVALTAGAATQLVVDAAAFMAFGPEHVEAARREHLLTVFCDFGANAIGDRFFFSAGSARCQFVRQRRACRRCRPADVGTAARHVGGDRDGAGHAGLRDDVGFLLVVARVQHGVLDLLRFFRTAERLSDFSIETVPTSTGWWRSPRIP